MAEKNPARQDQREGGYGDDTEARVLEGEAPREAGRETAGAGGRSGPLTSAEDADEALGNRTGGYGGPDTAVDQPDGASGNG